ncbi:MAG TPA: ATP-binding protein [Polyangiaceae bacterium]|nr:ATP-binding protein [Polyangiaceae bacterium]
MGGSDKPESAAQLLDALLLTPAFVAVVRGPRFVYEYVNDAYRKVAQLGDSPLGREFGDSRNPGVPRLLAALQHVYDSGQPWSDPEFRLEQPGPGGPKVYYFDVRFLPLRHDTEVVGALIHSYDITALVRTRLALAAELRERERAQRDSAELQHRLSQLQKAESLSVLAAAVAHDFNNMLTAVIGAVSSASGLVPGDHAAQGLLAEATDGAMRAAALTRQLLTYAGQAPAEPKPIDLSGHVREVARLLERTLPPRAHLRLNLELDLPFVDADPSQIQQVTMNLLMNAGEAIGERDGTVVVTTGNDPDGRVFLEVRDDGAGMDEPTKARVFDPFFSTKPRGSTPRGLGLASVLGIVRAHGGTVTVHSTPGVGTSFRVCFPRSARLATLERPTPAPGEWRGHGKVLLVDDDDRVRTALRHLLELLGFDVVDAPDGASALRLFAREPSLRLVLLDLTMPGMGGDEVFRQLSRARRDLPVVLTSGHERAMRATLRDEAVTPAAFLPKPFTLRELARTLERVLADKIPATRAG